MFEIYRWEIPVRKNHVPVYRYFSYRYTATKFNVGPYLMSPKDSAPASPRARRSLSGSWARGTEVTENHIGPILTGGASGRPCISWHFTLLLAVNNCIDYDIVLIMLTQMMVVVMHG